jgi:hypothetical protein
MIIRHNTSDGYKLDMYVYAGKYMLTVDGDVPTGY